MWGLVLILLCGTTLQPPCCNKLPGSTSYCAHCCVSGKTSRASGTHPLMHRTTSFHPNVVGS